MTVKTLVLGATALGCGLLLEGDGVLAVERGMILAPEYCAAFVSPEQTEPGTARGRALWEELQRRGLRHGSRLHLPPVSDVLANLIYQENKNLLLMTEVVEIRRAGAGYAASLMTPDGLRELTCERIVDSTSAGLARGQAPGFKKEIRVPLLFDGGFLPDMPGGAHVEFGPMENEAVLCVPVNPRDDWARMRRTLRDVWRTLRERKIGYLIAAESCAPAVLYDAPVRETIDDGWLFMPSASWGCLMSAFEEGVSCAF